MAIAKSEVLANLLRTGDYNVRVTIGEKDNTSNLAFVELIRDSLGGGIIHSDEVYDMIVYVINSDGSTTDLRFRSSGKQLIGQVSAFYPTRFGIRFDISDGKTLRSWVIVR